MVYCFIWGSALDSSALHLSCLITSIASHITIILIITIKHHQIKHRTLDYRYNSDFDDNVGHWQVVKHPTKQGWTRLLYSCKVKLFPWIPEFIVKFLTSTALKESTSWVKKEYVRMFRGLLLYCCCYISYLVVH